VGRALREQEALGQLDLEALEFAIRSSMHEVGGRLLEKLINSDAGGHRGPRTDCGQGHQAQFLDYRDKQVVTVLSPVKIQRAYYHCEDCNEGVIPKDRDLDIVDTSFSPGVRRLMGRVGAKEAFDEGRRDLEELAGVFVKTKAVERVSEALGQQISTISQQEQALALSGKLVPCVAVPKMYIAIDGTGVPVVPRECEGRRGKDGTGPAKTREAKLGCVFTQTRSDERGYPVRDDASTTYVGAIETAEAFGMRLFAEAVRRGVRRAQKVIILGDGAPWIWGIADEHFPGAIQVVDLYHAREHLAYVAKCVYGSSHVESKHWAAARAEQLDAGNVVAVIASMRWLRPRDNEVQKEVGKTIDYFEKNAERMRYADFRSQGLFVGSGVVEAGCKTIIGQRLKQSGMHWTIQGANNIIALRCCQLSSRWEEFWEARSVS
jgi:Uncharacterised protein family (UPF0236)